MGTTKTINQSLGLYRFQGRSNNPEKLMVIVDELNLPMLEKIMLMEKSGIQIIYILTDSVAVRTRFKFRSRIYPIQANIRSLLRHDIVDEIICCVSSLPEKYISEIKEVCRQFGVSLLVPPNIELSGLAIERKRFIGNFSFHVLETSPRKRDIFVLKSFFEMASASVALLLFSPMLLLIALIIKSTSAGPAIFRQQRVGLRGRKFYIYKFRTMNVDAEKKKAALKEYNESDGPAFKIKNDPRVTPFGRILRKTGLDEIPQLYNVVKGEMSLIGPRPMLPNEVSEQQEWQLKRLCIKPGITCTWQIQPDRNNVSFEKWMQLDRDYVENWSIGTDIKIFFSTIKSFFVASGI
jgi:lipopolysaccharide/colanic/teichoic acid biosynthesis glycosyltransferase